jgi:hypothetical protein
MTAVSLLRLGHIFSDVLAQNDATNSLFGFGLVGKWGLEILKSGNEQLSGVHYTPSALLSSSERLAAYRKFPGYCR